MFFQVFEIDQNTYFVELFSADNYFYLPVVPVRTLTSSRIVPETVGSGKFVSYGEFEHGS